jgi:dipeptidyl-peptidase 4
MRWLALIFAFALPVSLCAQGTQADFDRAARLARAAQDSVKMMSLNPIWSEDGKTLKYAAERDGKAETVAIDLATGKRTASPGKPEEEKRPTRKQDNNRPANRSELSPDTKWRVVAGEHNLSLREVSTKTVTPSTTDGVAGDSYSSSVFWSPDSTKFVAMKRKPGGDRRVTLVETAPKDQLQPKASSYFYLKPGDEIPQEKPHLFDVTTKKEIPISDKLFDNPWDIAYQHWSPDSQSFYFFYNQRGHGTVRVLKLDVKSGEVKAIINEETKTFFDYTNKLFLRYLDKTDEILWMSERSGWNHLYLIDAKTGQVKNPITSGEWVVRGVDAVDVDKRTIRFRLMGYDKKQDPYHVHYARVNFDGTGFTLLTEGDGTHTLSLSPDGQYAVDTYSRVDRLTRHELRRMSDGKLVAELERADNTEWAKLGLTMPERFVAKGRDGTTDIHGIVVRPSTFDSQKKYKVIEYIYAGPHDHHVTKKFRPYHHIMQNMAELGFVVVMIDGMGTNWRSKAFHDVCHKNLGDSGFPDRIAWIRALDKDYTTLDISQGVGIFGGSAGGQSSTRALLAHGDFYKVAVSDCGCHDNRMDKIWWNEMWMSWPIGKHYEEQSNVTQAHKLTGKLMLVVGELDKNVDPASTIQVAAALVKANKDFDLLIIPGAGHGAAESPYGSRRRADFFVRHMLGVEPRKN